MKRFCWLVAVAALFVGCLKDMPVSNLGKDAKTVSDLKVPASFDWNTTVDKVVCRVSSETVARVSLAETAADAPFATFFAGGQLDPVALSLPSAVNTVYVRYQTVDGAMSAPQAVRVASNAISYAVGPNNDSFDDTDIELDEGQNTIYMPARANGWGTILFEDMWPGKGDYDFNDVVFNYKVQLSLTADNRVEAMQLGIRVKAVSGSFPYELYLQMHGMKNDWIGEIERTSVRNSTTAALTLLPPPDVNKNRALFRFDGIRSNPNKPAGGMWTNTEPGYELADDQLVEVSYVVYLAEPIALANVSFAGLDFFLGQMQDGVLGAEIHRCNYEPINMSYYLSKADPSVVDYYKTKNNLVWAVNVPVNIPHTYEKVDFLKAYPEFKAWAQSGGAQSKDWYKRGVDEYLVRNR